MRRLTVSLAAVAIGVGTALVAAPPAAAADPSFTCLNDDTANSDATPWYNGHYNVSRPLSRSLLDRHIPQGLATWKNYYGSGKDLLVYTAYSQDGGRARIQGIDESDGSLTHYARIRKGHAGGVAIVKSWAFVSGPSGTVVRYRLDKLKKFFAGTASDDSMSGVVVKVYRDGHRLTGVVGNSFLAAKAGTLYAGTFNDSGLGKMRKYAVRPDGDLDQASGDIQVPKKTQGLAVLDNYFVFSTSLGRHNRSNVYVVKRGYSKLTTSYKNKNLRCVRIPTMSEGVTVSNGRIYQLFESGADCYANDEVDCRTQANKPLGKPDRVIKRLHRIPRATLINDLPVAR